MNNRMVTFFVLFISLNNVAIGMHAPASSSDSRSENQNTEAAELDSYDLRATAKALEKASEEFCEKFDARLAESLRDRQAALTNLQENNALLAAAFRDNQAAQAAVSVRSTDNYPENQDDLITYFNGDLRAAASALKKACAMQMQNIERNTQAAIIRLRLNEQAIRDAMQRSATESQDEEIFLQKMLNS